MKNTLNSKVILIAICIYVFILTQSLIGQDGLWEPTPSPKVLTTFLEVDGNQLIAGYYGKGIFFSKDYGESWESYATNSISLFPSSFRQIDGEIYVTSLDKGLLVSHDHGESWNVLNDGLENRQSLNHVEFNGVHFVGTDHGLYELKNGAWKEVDVGLKNKDRRHFKIQGIDASQNELYVSTNGALFVYELNERTWLEYPLPTKFETTFLKLDGDVIFLGTTGNGILKIPNQQLQA